MNHRFFRQRGQAMTEYMIVVALIAVGAIGVYQVFGQVVRSQTTAMVRELAGNDGSLESQAAQTATNDMKAETQARTLKSFAGHSKAPAAQ